MNSPLYNDSSLPIEMENRVHDELRDGERLLWVGQPNPARYAKKAIPIVLFGVPWTLFSLFWMAGAAGLLFGAGGFRGGGVMNFVFPLFGLPFVLIGLGMLSSPYWLKKRAGRTFYAVTDQRAILWEASWLGSTEVRAYDGEKLDRMRRVEYPGGEGDLIFEEFITYGRNSDGHRTSNIKRHGFMAIDGVREVDELIRQALLSEKK